MAVAPNPSPSWLARAGAWARRPQTAMGAVFVMTAASSALVLARKHHGAGASLSVHEQGAPLAVATEPEASPGAVAEPSAEFVPTTTGTGSARPQTNPTIPSAASTIEEALALQQKGAIDPAIEAFRTLAEGGDPRARYLQGRAERERYGCARARETFAKLAVDSSVGAVAFDARLEEGRCARQLGDEEGARRALQTLLDVPSHRERALAEMRELD
jgi:TolA-binding protein